MKNHFHHSRRVRAFTLVELLVVLVIMGIVVSASVVGIRGLTNSGKFDKALGEVSGIFEQARSYAVAQDTYVWVVLYENAPAGSGPLDVYAGAFASSDGTDPFSWTGTVTFPSPGTVGSTTLTPITRLYHFKGLHLQTTTLPNGPTSPSYPASVPIFQCTAQSDAGPVTLSNTSSVYWLVQFTPTGAARVGPSPVDSIWFGMQPASTATIFDRRNSASMKVNGLTGLTSIYR